MPRMSNRTINFKRISINGSVANVHETPSFMMGFTETGFPLESFSELTGLRVLTLKQLKQTHSDIVHFSSNIPAATVTAGEYEEPHIEEPCQSMEGDGIIVDERGTMAIIKTADCTPLFFHHPAGNFGGILHIGWRGLQKKIEKKALTMIKHMKQPVKQSELEFFTGPAIECDCYEVGSELFDDFESAGFRQEIFHKTPEKNEKYLLDVKKGVYCSLKEEGIEGKKIKDSGICTYCEKERFPSYRREKSGGRIFNFFMLK